MEVIDNSSYAKLARKSLEYYLLTSKEIDLPPEFTNTPLPKAAVFVSIKRNGENRGCQGSFATQPNMVLEIVKNAIKAGTQDPRFWPVKIGEMKDLVFSVDVLLTPEKVQSLEELNPAEYGIIINSIGRKQKHAVLLPNLEDIPTVERQLQIVKNKAKITPNDAYELYRFSVVRHLE